MTTSIESSSLLSVSGLASGLETGKIISALLASEKRPEARIGAEKLTVEGQHEQLESIQSALTQLTFSAQELASPELFNSAEAVTSSNSAQLTATATSGAALGGYEVEVTQLANAAQRTFSFKSPAAADAITIDGEEFTLAAGASIQSLVNTINASSTASVYASAMGSETLVLSNRATGASGAGYIDVSDTQGALSEQAGLAKEGRNAIFSVDGTNGSSASNTVTDAIPGVTLSLKSVTTATGPVTVEVQPPSVDSSAITAQVQAFIKLYNSTITTIKQQLATKPSSYSESETTAALKAGTLYGDSELEGFLNELRQVNYDPQAGLTSGMSSLADIGVSTGAPSGSATTSQSTLEGQLQLNTSKLEEALSSDPASVEAVLHGWASSFESVVNRAAQPGGSLETRMQSDSSQALELAARVTAMNEVIALHQRTLQAQFTAMEAAVSRNQSQLSWLSSEVSSLSS